MTFETVSPESLARSIHHYREALASDVGCRPSLILKWDDLSQDERNRMIAAIRLALFDLCSERCHLPSESGFLGGTEGKECGC